MFLCESCVKKDKVNITNKSYALLMFEIGRVSYGPCESCRKVDECVDA